MTPRICEVHQAHHTGGIVSRYTDYWYQVVVTDGTKSQVIAETPRRRNHRAHSVAARAADSRADLAELERTLQGEGWQPLAGSINGLPRFQRRQE